MPPERTPRRFDDGDGYRTRREYPPGYRPASGIINAKQNMETTKGFSGLNGAYALQDRRRPAFPRPGFKGQSASEIGEYLTERNVAINRDGRFSPRDQIMGRGQGASGMSRRGGEPPTMRNRPTPPANAGGGGAMGAAARTAGAVMDAAARTAGIGGGGASPRQEFGGRSRGGGGSPRGEWQRPTENPRGPTPTAADTAARAAEMRDERSMANDMKNDVSRTRDNMGRVTDMSSKHGSGSVEFLDKKQQANRPPGMTRDDLGRPQPIRNEINRMTENQATKGIGPQGQPMAPAGGAGPQQAAAPAAGGAAMGAGKGVVGGAVGGPGKSNTAESPGSGASLMETANEIMSMKPGSGAANPSAPGGITPPTGGIVQGGAAQAAGGAAPAAGAAAGTAKNMANAAAAAGATGSTTKKKGAST